MKVTNAGDKGQVSIGFTCRDYNLRRQPGWESNSCGYHGDDGFIYRGHGKGEAFGPTYTTGDTVGAGINYASQEFFFTKNGKLVGTVDKDIKGPLYPTVAVHGQNEKVTVNFGQQHFLFDIKTYRSEEILKQRKLFEKLPLPPNVSHWIVRSYLLHYGYQDTLSSFDAESENSSLRNPTAQENGISEQEDAYALNHRKNLRQLIRKGNIDSAFRYLRNWYPQVVQVETSAICFLLHAQRFIEHIRDNQLLDAVNYARTELNKFLKVEPFEGMLEDAIALLAYDNPAKSCVGYLLKQSQREFVADAVNAVILSTNPNTKNVESCMYSCMEKLLRQLTLCVWERRALNENQGEAFDLHREQRRWGWKTLDD
ncbi:uncharacterized protein A4U43_UnF160 [Asparagus officinalis]|uniref:B30.2/SPRY domain-containing protein n=2 Tax=Asparagus officinalis TaxID=4686 RepID=A0A1R3L7V1_ASPOF|nr:uncharacterized protein A4U43_UnF160 [Asparagus officinalis]